MMQTAGMETTAQRASKRKPAPAPSSVSKVARSAALPPPKYGRAKPPSARKLEAMTCWPHARDMLAEGYSASAVAAYIQGEARERTDIKRETLEGHLLAYRTDFMPAAVFAGAAAVRPGGWLRQRMEDETLEYGRLEELYRLQKFRIDQGLAREQQTGEQSPCVGQALRDAVDTVCRMHAVKEAYGFAHGGKSASVVVNQSVVLNVQQRFGDEVAAVLQRPAARGRVLALLEEFRAAADDGEAYGLAEGELLDIEGNEGADEAPAP